MQPHLCLRVNNDIMALTGVVCKSDLMKREAVRASGGKITAYHRSVLSS